MKSVFQGLISIAILAIGVLSVWHLLGLDLSIETGVSDAAEGILISELLPIPDFKVIMYVVVAVIVYKVFGNRKMFLHSLASMGMILTILSLILSFTPVGTFAPYVGITIKKHVVRSIVEAKQGTASNPKEGGGYTITNKKVICVNDPDNPTITISGTLNNISTNDWNGGVILFWSMMEDGTNGNIPIEFELVFENTVASGESLDFELQKPYFSGVIEKRDFTDFMVWKMHMNAVAYYDREYYNLNKGTN